MELYGQLQIFLVTLLTGALLGVIFDFYRVLRGVFRPRFMITTVADLVYWVVATVTVLVSLLLCNWLELRLYVFLGMLGGGVAYYRLFSRYAIYLLIRMIRLIGWLLRLGQKFFVYIVIMPVSFVVRLLTWPFIHTRRQLGRVWRRISAIRPPKDKPPPA
jgi:spore cortex biosynthesis protein YabQ